MVLYSHSCEHCPYCFKDDNETNEGEGWNCTHPSNQESNWDQPHVPTTCVVGEFADWARWNIAKEDRFDVKKAIEGFKEEYEINTDFEFSNEIYIDL
jgi:hypothetical protein